MKLISVHWQKCSEEKECSAQSTLGQKIGGDRLVLSEKVILELTSERQL